MSVAVNRQIRIDEDVQGFHDEQLAGLIHLGEIMLDGHQLLVPSEREKLESRISMFRAEQRRREERASWDR